VTSTAAATIKAATATSTMRIATTASTTRCRVGRGVRPMKEIHALLEV
jgi:hypothetical protein